MPKHFFLPEQSKAIVEAIQQSEKNTSGEIRVHLQKHLHCKSALEEAQQLFTKLNMHQTKERNAVLFFLVTEDHHFAVFSDQGINDLVPANFWEEIKEVAIAEFKKNNFAEGLIQGILKTGEKLKTFFPHQAHSDTNELPNEISIQDDQN